MPDNTNPSIPEDRIKADKLRAKAIRASSTSSNLMLPPFGGAGTSALGRHPAGAVLRLPGEATYGARPSQYADSGLGGGRQLGPG